uniref:Peptidase M13 N-terminal domain-containing protein n=1 Tax=Timema shepardi TaxID=629360 RepID=A0A7R9AWB5_TIMSH|nr:unnamed protein product [Timema shepardi]
MWFQVTDPEISSDDGSRQHHQKQNIPSDSVHKNNKCHLSHTRYAVVTRNTQTPDSLVHSRAVHTTPARATRTLDSPVHSRAVHTTPALATRTLDSPVHSLALGTPGLISREPRTEMRLPLSIHLQTCLRPPPHTPSASIIPQSSEKVAAYPLDKEGDRENKGRSHKGQQREHADVKTGEKMAQHRLAVSSCISKDCVQSASRIFESVNKEVNPCEDFYEFACGGWIKSHPVPETQSSWDQFWSLREALLLDLRELLEEPGSEDEINPVKQARALYRTCLDQDKLEVLGVEPMMEVMQRLKVSPIPPRARKPSEDKFDWVYTAGRAQRILGLNMLFGFWVSQDIRNTSRNLMVVDQISPGISERYLLDTERFHTELTEYRRYIEDMVRVFEAHLVQTQQHSTDDHKEDDEEEHDINKLSLAFLHGRVERAGESVAEQFTDDILEFSTKLATIMTSAEDRRDPKNLFHEMTLAQLQELTDVPDAGANVKMNWTWYLDNVLKDTNVTLDLEKDIVVVMEMNYLQKLANLITKTDPVVLERYVWWSIFSTLAPLTLQEFRDLAFRFSKQVFGLTQKTPRWKGCTGNVNSNFGMAVSYLYVQKHFNNQSRVKALEMVNDIRSAFTEIVTELQWMDEETKQRTLDKAHAMRPFIGFPGWLLTPGELEKYYQGAS